MASSTRACFLTFCFLSFLGDGLRSRGTSGDPAFSAPSMNPLQFLIISSPSEKRLVWTTLKNFESNEGRPFTLVDTGLHEPKGIALDKKNGLIYVADKGAKKIFSYKIIIDLSGPTPKIDTTGARVTICQGHAAEWVTVDDKGNLFYTAPDSNNINKISTKVLEKIRLGEFQPGSLEIVSEKMLVASQISKSKAKATVVSSDAGTDGEAGAAHDSEAVVSADADTDDSEAQDMAVKPYILSIYESEINPHVAKPSAVWADGKSLYWGNGKSGKTAGTIVKGLVEPTVKGDGKTPFPATALTTVSDGAFGIAKAGDVMFFTQNGSVQGTGLVSGFMKQNPESLVDFEQSLATPRGLVYDGQATMYVADEDGGDVWSFPTGRLMANAPLTHTVKMLGPYGLAILSSTDPAFKSIQTHDMDNEGLLTSAKQSEAGVVPEGFGGLQFMSKRSSSNQTHTRSSSNQKRGLLSVFLGLATIVSQTALQP